MTLGPRARVNISGTFVHIEGMEMKKLGSN
jgi:hypothetical protein